MPYEDWMDYRYTILGKKLSEENHEITWLASNFSHHTKKHRYPESKKLKVNSNFKLSLVKSPGYKKNVSLKRIFSELVYSKRAIQILKDEIDNVDMIIVSGTNFTSQSLAVNFAHANNIPIIIDVLDIWPEVFLNAFPAFLRPFINLLFKPFYWIRKNDFKRASGIVFCTNSFKDHLIEITPSNLKKNSTVTYLCSASFTDNILNIAINANNFLPKKEINDIWFTYAGSLGDQYDLRCLKEVFISLQEKQEIKLLVAGDGPKKNLFSKISTKNIYFLGKLDHLKLIELYKKTDILMCSYSKNSKVSMPTKAFDAINHNLPIITSIDGDLGDLIKSNKIGYFYAAGSSVSMSNIINYIADNPNLIKEMRQRIKDIKNLYTIDAQYKNFINLVEDIYKKN